MRRRGLGEGQLGGIDASGEMPASLGRRAEGWHRWREVYSRLVWRARMASGVVCRRSRSFRIMTSNSTNSAPS